MSGLDKILEQITQEARKEAEQILSSAREEARKILESGKREAEDMANAVHRQSELDVSAAADRIRSRADLSEKRIILQAKQDRIEAVFEKALACLDALSDEEYMDVIVRMLRRYASGQDGLVFFNSRDLARLSDAAKDAALEKHLQIREEPADIRGGFILSYGDIEENCSFDVLMSESREELQDKIGLLLFGQQDL